VEGYDASTYGDRIADVYDDWYGDAAFLETEEAVAALAELAGKGPAVEVRIGTGRIALPLAARGVDVHGIDASEAMVDKLREKPGGDAIPVTIGDFADVGVDASYSLVYVVFNTFFALHSQDEQVRCFQNVAAHLTDDGVFVVEAFTPGYLHRLREHQYVDAEEIRVDKVWLDVAQHDPVAQRLVKNHVALTSSGIELNPVVLRYAWPSELDLMARIAGLELAARWGDWERRPFDASSRLHVSVWSRSSSHD